MDVSRRSIVRGAAWSVPVVAVAAQAPAFAASKSINNSINGWVQISPEKRNNDSQGRFRMDSTVAGSVNGELYGLYIIDTEAEDVFTNAFIEVDILGNNTMSIPSPGPGWSTGARQGTVVGNDDGTNRTYSRYRFSYSGAFDRRGDNRVWLNDFDVTTPWYNLPSRGGITYWVRRFVTVNGTQRFFERRNGDLGFIDYNGSAPSLQRRAKGEAPVDAA